MCIRNVCYSSNFYYMLKQTKKEVLKKTFFALSEGKIIKDNLVQRASLAFFHLITKASSSGQEHITRSLQRLSLSLFDRPYLKKLSRQVLCLSANQYTMSRLRHMHKLALKKTGSKRWTPLSRG